MMDSDFWTLTELGHNYFGGISGKEVGKTLKLARLRTPDGKPTSSAIELGLTRKFDGPQPWIPLWKWHKEKVLPYLKNHGLEVIEVVQEKTEVTEMTKVDEKQVAAQAKEYLQKYGVCLSWDFYEENPPSQVVREFLMSRGDELIDPSCGEQEVVDYAVDLIELDWLADDDDQGAKQP